MVSPETKHRIANRLHFDPGKARDQLKQGLLADPAHIDPKYFYDDLGCTLYAAICRLDEYYLTRIEQAIFQENRIEIATEIGQGGTFVDLGAGDCAKARCWLPFLKPARYLAVDIAGPLLDTTLADMATEFPSVDMIGLITDFSSRLELPDILLQGPVTLFYPGSSIGNFAPADALRLLGEIRSYASNGLLIGVDAKKDKAILEAAYADKLGVTAAFNRNVLRHINRLIDAGFDETKWQHISRYEIEAGRVEMYLEAREVQSIALDGATRWFKQGERIHSENSYKYHRAEFEALLRQAGFADVRCWNDAEDFFWVFFAH